MSGRFEAKVALVTGGASGIGLAAAEAFAREGAHVVIADLDGERAARAADAIGRDGGRATSVGVDVSDHDGCVAMVEHCMSAFGGLHVAFNNAGWSPPVGESIDTIAIAAWHKVIATNLTGVFHCIRAELPALRASGGTAIVNTASSASFSAPPGLAAYASSKHGVAGLTKCAANDLIRYGIRVNAVCPGIVDTAMTAPLLDVAELRSSYEALVPIARVAAPSEIAEAVLFLASDAASYLVGELLRVDGGLTLN